jgi:4-hydroxyphenylacetate 3-hydroxylase N terminal
MKTIIEEPVASAKKMAIPLTGSEYLESLKDGRQVWIYGEKVKDVTSHPAFRNSARMIARLYDALHDPSRKDILTMPTDDGGFTHRFYRAPRNAGEQVGIRDAIALWARITYGWLGRSPDYKAAFLATLGANNDFYKRSMRTRNDGITRHRREPIFSIMPSFIRRSIATRRPMKWVMFTSTSMKKGTAG